LASASVMTSTSIVTSCAIAFRYSIVSLAKWMRKNTFCSYWRILPEAIAELLWLFRKEYIASGSFSSHVAPLHFGCLRDLFFLLIPLSLWEDRAIHYEAVIFEYLQHHQNVRDTRRISVNYSMTEPTCA